MAYTKLHQSLVTSTIWREPSPTRIVWVTLMAMADKNGEVMASIPGLADVARVTLQECETALTAFLSPDKYSRTKTLEGRRIQEVKGGWFLINHPEYRAMASREDETQKASARMARHRRNKALHGVTVAENLHIAEAEAEADNKEEEPSAPVASKKAEIPIPALLDTPEFRAVWADWEQHRREKKQAITPTTRNRQLKNMAEIGVVRAIAAIEESISQGWQGIYEPKGGVAAGGLPVWKRVKDLEEEEKLLAGRLHQFFDREADPAGVARLTAVRLELSKLKT